MRKVKQGEMIEVRDFSSEPWRKREFLAVDSSGYYCKLRDAYSKTKCWGFAREIQESKRIPFTFDTFPRGVVYLRIKSSDCSMALVTMIMQTSIETSIECATYATLLPHYEISTDLGETWNPCGTLGSINE